MNAGCALHLDIRATIAIAAAVGFGGILFIFLVDAASFSGCCCGCGGRVLLSGGIGQTRWGCPSWDLPCNASEALELETALGPLAARFAGPVEGTKPSVDGSLVGLGTKLMAASGFGMVNSSVLTINLISVDSFWGK